MKTSSKVLIGTGIALFVPLPLLMVGLAGFGGVMAYKGVKHVKSGYVGSKRRMFFKGKDKNRAYVSSSVTGLSEKELMDVGTAHSDQTIRSDWFKATGFIPATVPKSDLESLSITTLNPRTGTPVVVTSYDTYNERTGCAEIPTRPYYQQVKEKRGRTKMVRCDRVAVKLDSHGNIDWSKSANRELFKNPQAVAEVLRKYPESFETIPNEILHETVATGLTMGDFLCGKVKQEIIDRKMGTSEYWTEHPRRQDGSARTQTQYFVDIHRMMQTKANLYAAQYGRTSNFKSTVNAWTSAPSSERYF